MTSMDDTHPLACRPMMSMWSAQVRSTTASLPAIFTVFWKMLVSDGCQRARQQGVAVGRGILDRLCRDQATSARPVLDDHRLPEAAAHFFGGQACDHIGDASCARADEEFDRRGGVGLRHHGRGEEQGGEEHQCLGCRGRKGGAGGARG